MAKVQKEKHYFEWVSRKIKHNKTVTEKIMGVERKWKEFVVLLCIAVSTYVRARCVLCAFGVVLLEGQAQRLHSAQDSLGGISGTRPAQPQQQRHKTQTHQLVIFLYFFCSDASPFSKTKSKKKQTKTDTQIGGIGSLWFDRQIDNPAARYNK